MSTLYDSDLTYDSDALTYDGYDTTPNTEFPQARLPFRCEIAFGVQPDVAFINPTAWSNVTPYFLDQTVTINRGRANETDETQVMTMGFELDNATGVFTPDNAESILYPYVRRGVLCRFGIYGGESFFQIPDVLVPTDYISTPDDATLDITGDFDLAFEIQPYSIVAGNQLFGKWRATGNQRSWDVIAQQDPDHPTTFRMALQWSPDGTLASGTGAATAYTFSYQDKQVIRVTVDVDNGAGNHVVNWYTADKWGEDWALFLTTTYAGVIPFFNSTAPLDLGSPDFTYYPFVGKYFKMQLRQGIGGPLIVDLDFTTVPPGETSFTDNTGRVWTVTGTAAIDNLHTRFFGQVDSFEVTWPYGDSTSESVPPECRVVCQASSLRRKMGQGDQPIQSVLRRGISSEDLVVAYWPLEDEADSTVGASGIPNEQAATVIGFDFESIDTLPGSASLPTLETLASFAGVVPPYAVTPYVSVGWMMFSPTVPTIDQVLMRIKMPGGTLNQVVIGLNATQFTIRGYDAGGTLISAAGGAHSNLFLNRWGTWVVGITQVGANVDVNVFYIPLGNGSVWTFSGLLTFAGRTMANVSLLSSEFGSQMGDYGIGHVSVLRETNGNVYTEYDDGWSGELAINRFRRLCDEEGVACDTGEVPTLSLPLGPQRMDTILSLLSETAYSSNGVFLDARFFNGLQYIPLYDLINQSVQMALDASAEHITNPLSPTLDDQSIRNQVESSRVNGSSVTRQDDDSIAKEGLYADQVTVNVESDNQLGNDANWRLHLGTVEGMTYPPITIELAKAPDLIPIWLNENTDVGSVITLDNLPRQADTTLKRFIIQGYTETISPTKWTVVLNCTPYQPYEVTQFDGEFTTLRLDSDLSTLDAGINSVVGSLTVNLNGGASWTTDPTDLPFDIKLAGEYMRVTAVGAVIAGKQILTVTRSINEVTKSHIAGESIHIAYPVVLSLV